MYSDLIQQNIRAIYSNLAGGYAGIIMYPLIQYTTSIPIGTYAIICYSIHHIHILSCLKNIVILESKQKKLINKYINCNIHYNVNKITYSYDDKRKSLYSLKINNFIKENNFIEENKFWYTKAIKSSSFSYDCQNAIHKYVSYRDNNTKTIIGITSITTLYYCNTPYIILGFFSGLLTSIVYYGINKINTDYNALISIIQKEMYSEKKYFYINTFGDIVFTNYKKGLYTRYNTLYKKS